jgi:phosphoribosylformylglycinamidine synthase
MIVIKGSSAKNYNKNGFVGAAQFVHFVDGDVSSEQEIKLRKLLDYGQDFSAQETNNFVIVIPRIGTISPWSSKATEIARNTGLDTVKRIERGVVYYFADGLDATKLDLHDKMTEQIVDDFDQAEQLFGTHTAKTLSTIPILSEGIQALEVANKNLGLALSADEMDYLLESYNKLDRDPTDVELMMFSQANSEHCRHKIFNASWTIDGEEQDLSLFQMIKNTFKNNPDGVKSAYHDNGAVLSGSESQRLLIDPETHEYKTIQEVADIVIKAETHNHPTAIAPFPGSGTGSGGEIRDEGATGRGAKPKAGLVGFNVSNLRIPGATQPWEVEDYGYPARLSSALEIMTEGPLGAAAFNNEFGRVGLTGYFRTFEQTIDGQRRGYHKPIMIGGGLANIRPKDVDKKQIPAGAKIITLGGPALSIGLGGGAASSQHTGAQDEDLDFASVQRQNPEMQRRAQEVINSCFSFDNNPILSIHDVGAGGWSNALPELVKDANKGAILHLRDLPIAESGMSPLEIWSNEAQERYVLAVLPDDIDRFLDVCQRERCPVAVLGEATDQQDLVVDDVEFHNNPVDIPMDLLFGSSPKTKKQYSTIAQSTKNDDISDIDINDAVQRVLSLPAVASKSFLITIGDRTVGGMTARDQMVGPWQIPVADVAVTANDFSGNAGEAMAMGERPNTALHNPAASGRMAIGELITNMVASDISSVNEIKLSANWMAASGLAVEDQALYETVRAVGMDFCPALGLTIPVGKDSLSMRTTWQDGGDKSVVSPMTLVVSGFAKVSDVTKTLTPQLVNKPDTSLILVDLSGGNKRLGASALSQVYNKVVTDVADIKNPEILNTFFEQLKKLKNENLVLAYHDRSDGGLFVTVSEMCFAGRVGAELCIEPSLENLFNEELGAVIQVKDSDVEKVLQTLDNAEVIGRVGDNNLIIGSYTWSVSELLKVWQKPSFEIVKLRDNPKTAQQEFDTQTNFSNKGLWSNVPNDKIKTGSLTQLNAKPKVAILREQGVNGNIEMAAAFNHVGFQAVDVHMSDLLSGTTKLQNFTGLAACGGFSYGDVLGAGGGWAKTILFNSQLKAHFSDFFNRDDTFSLGICNGCQMLAQIKELIPGASTWPKFLQNESQRFEARLSMVEIQQSPSIFFKDMAGWQVPVPVSHGEGRAVFDQENDKSDCLSCMKYIDQSGVAETFPANPNGSPDGLTAFTSLDGRATIMMPHPERVFLTRQLSWKPEEWDNSFESPWINMFVNARNWVNGR